MISDVLSDAAISVREYLDDPTFNPCYQGNVRARIEVLLIAMDMVRAELDMLPSAEVQRTTHGAPPILLRIPGSIPDLDERLREAAFVSDADGIILRVQPEFYFPKGRNQRTYVRWSGVQWGLKTSSELLSQFRKDLHTFIMAWWLDKQGGGKR